MIEVLSGNEIPDWVSFPKLYIELVKNEKDEFLPWYLMDKKDLLIRCKGLKERYPARTLFPFARHDMCDDIACWEKEKPGKVVLLHDYASPGWENRMEFSSFEEWYQYVLTLQEEY